MEMENFEKIFEEAKKASIESQMRMLKDVESAMNDPRSQLMQNLVENEGYAWIGHNNKNKKTMVFKEMFKPCSRFSVFLNGLEKNYGTILRMEQEWGDDPCMVRLSIPESKKDCGMFLFPYSSPGW